MKVLIVEDDRPTAAALQLLLDAEGIIHDTAYLGEEGLNISKLTDSNGVPIYDLIILDLILPDINGFEVLLKIRANKVSTPVLILSGLNNTDQKVKGFAFGADDYITKPYESRELVSRVRAIVRRSKGHSESVIEFGSDPYKIVLNLDARNVQVNGVPLHLTSKEYSIFELLAVRKGTVLTKETFLSNLYDGVDEPELKIIDVFVCKLRKKLADAAGGRNYIETVWGRGYMLRENPATEPTASPEVKGKKDVLMS